MDLIVSTKARYFSAAALLLGMTLSFGLSAAHADSAQVSKLLQDSKNSALDLKQVSVDMERYAITKKTWGAHAQQVYQVKDHVNRSGKILADLHQARAGADPWQQEAIDKITPLLQEMASNTNSIIDHLNDKRQTWQPEYHAYLTANADLATDLSRLIVDYIDLGKAKSKSQSMGQKLGFTNA